MEKFYILYSENAGVLFTYRYFSKKDATQQAKELAKLFKSPVYVLGTTDCVAEDGSTILKPKKTDLPY